MLGIVADHDGPRGAFVAIAVIPLLAIALAFRLRQPTESTAQVDPIAGVRGAGPVR